MKILLVRHAIAEERAAFSGDDDQRPLTAEGRRKMKEIARGLRRQLRAQPSGLIVSPLLRAQQTADLLTCVWPKIPLVTTDVLRPEFMPVKVAKWVERNFSGDFAVLVGHEPQLSELICYFIASRAPLKLKKGGACLLEFSAGPVAGEGRLVWLATPALLRR